MTPCFLGALKSCTFEETLKMGAINSTPWFEFLTEWGHVQMLRVKINDQGGKITLWELERMCQLVVRLKANKYYQELLCSLSSYIKLLNVLNLQGLCNWLLAPGRFQTCSPWSRPLTNSKPLAGLILVLVFGQLFLDKVCRNPTALRWVICFVAIRLCSDKSLDLGQ